MLLVHSPLVGPSSWSTVAERATHEGYDVIVPDLTGVADATPPQWGYFVDAAVQSAELQDDNMADQIVLVGHSGAGVFLPLIANRLRRRCTATIFVDAVVPPAAGSHRTSSTMTAMLDHVTVAGRLKPWLRWWPDEVVATLVPDALDRDRLLADMPHLPRAFYDDDVPMPHSWSSRPNAYLRLSHAYDSDQAAAVALGWPASSIDGTHLSIVDSPGTVLAGIQSLVERTTRGAHR